MELDSHKLFEEFDPEDVGHGIENLPEQIRLAWHDTRDIIVPKSFSEILNIVVAGMGGSALGPYMLRSAFSDRISIPVEVVRDYTLPGYVNRQTLVILSSFSGGTEEVLHVAQAAKKAKAKIMVIAAGGELVKMAQEEKWPYYAFDATDLAKQPRYGVGFSLIGIAGLLERAGFLKMKEEELQVMMAAMGEVIDNCAVDVPTKENPAKQVAEALHKKNVFVVAAEHLSGNANTFNNQINENAKQLSDYHILPEVNHHFMEALLFPEHVVQSSVVVLFKSGQYHPRILKRCEISADIFEQKGIPVIEYLCKGSSRLEEMGEVLQFGSYVAWYLAILNHVVTTDISTVNELKRRMIE